MNTNVFVFENLYYILTIYKILVCLLYTIYAVILLTMRRRKQEHRDKLRSPRSVKKSDVTTLTLLNAVFLLIIFKPHAYENFHSSWYLTVISRIILDCNFLAFYQKGILVSMCFVVLLNLLLSVNLMQLVFGCLRIFL